MGVWREEEILRGMRSPVGDRVPRGESEADWGIDKESSD